MSEEIVELSEEILAEIFDENPGDPVIGLNIEDNGEESYWFYCDGCKTHHSFRTKAADDDKDSPIWKFNDNLASPTFKPSLSISYGDGKEASHCHLFLEDGMVRYLWDCKHHLKDKTVPVVPPWQKK